MKREVGIEEMIDCAFKLGAETMLKKIAESVDADGNLHPRIGNELAKYAIEGVTQDKVELIMGRNKSE